MKTKSWVHMESYGGSVEIHALGSLIGLNSLVGCYKIIGTWLS